MIAHLLDTDHFSLLEQGHPVVTARLEAETPDSVAISVVTVEESLRGRLAVLSRRLDGSKRIHAYTKLIETMSVLGRRPFVPFDQSCENRYQELLSLRLRVGTSDLKIAAIALANNLILVTRNRRDFERVPALRIEDWSLP